MPRTSHVFEKIIDQGINFLLGQQQKNGSFLGLSSASRTSFRISQEYRTIFPTFLVLSCLQTLEETPKIKIIKQKAAKFLLSQKSEYWSFNYWVRNSKESRKMPYPDDLDDTFCALAALYQYNSGLIGGAEMARIVTLLTAMEKREGGPYRTWLVPKTADKIWQDVDLVANSNIAYFLSLQDISLPNINALIERAIDDGAYYSPYYPSIYPVIYFIARFYRGEKADRTKKFLLAKRQKGGKWVNPINTALATSALLNLGVPPKEIKTSIDYLVSQQIKDGWKPYPLCLDPEIKGKKYYAGSSAVTTALCLEALGKYESKFKIAVQSSKITDKAEEISQKLADKAKRRFSVLNGELKKIALTTLKKTFEKDKDKQIALLPYLFKLSLGKTKKDIPSQMLVQLGLTNLYGWMAYTIYDDFLDDEGEPELLSLANVCLRESTTIYGNLLPEESGFSVFLEKIVDTIDAANTWEVVHCRFNPKHIPTSNIPDYGDYSRLADRSLGHALGPVAILFSLGYNASSSEVKNLIKFFKHYLIARQLNDDAHDWEDDLKKGRINAIGAQVLTHFSSRKKYNSIRATLPELRKVFWVKVFKGVYEKILYHTSQARRLLQSGLIKEASFLERLVFSVEQAAQMGIKEQVESMKFLEAYGKNSRHGPRGTL